MEINNYDELIQKVNDIKKDVQIDLSVEEDLAVAVMNLISLEEHFFFTANKTGQDEYFETLKMIREMRKKLLKLLIVKYEGEVWCISKHLLAASMRLIEVGTKMLGKGDTDLAKDMFSKAYELFNIFFKLKIKMTQLPEKSSAGPQTQEELISELLDCCKE